ncbi:MAG: flagellar hook-length control protein FliK, partial [Paludibacteraceae bacterium]|nr:flagellar hook-length control protein FliK [Paludibacteraceae bacterium]
AGQTLRGEIISVKGEDVQLAILKDVIIDAKLAQSMNLSPGISMPFQVKSNNQNGLSLIPLFTNTALDPNAIKALDMAGLPVNDRSLEMVLNLMEKGMPIDKKTLQETYRDVAMLKEYPVKDIISLRQLQMPVNAENLNQLSAYENNQHYLNDTFSEIGNALSQHINELVTQGDLQGAKSLISELQRIFQQTDLNLMEEKNDVVQKDGTILSLDRELSQGQKLTDNTPNNLIVLKGGEENATQQISSNLQEQSKLDGFKLQNQKTADNPNYFSEENVENTDSKKVVVEQKSVSFEDLLRELDKGKDGANLSRLFEKVWKKEVSNQWNMEPETLLDKKQVKSYYEKLDAGIKQLERILEETTSVKSPVAKVVQNTSSNLDFMNQLHQMHAYMQLPLKMTGQNARGELYVFSNKKNLTKQDGKVTALLHLDMEHLGKMDIYVALEDKKVSTNFYLEREEYLDFLEANMDMLNTRLQKRGYECSIKTSLRNEDEESVMRVIEKQQGKSVLLSTQAFDVRA